MKQLSLLWLSMVLIVPNFCIQAIEKQEALTEIDQLFEQLAQGTHPDLTAKIGPVNGIMRFSSRSEQPNLNAIARYEKPASVAGTNKQFVEIFWNEDALTKNGLDRRMSVRAQKQEILRAIERFFWGRNKPYLKTTVNTPLSNMTQSVDDIVLYQDIASLNGDKTATIRLKSRGNI